MNQCDLNSSLYYSVVSGDLSKAEDAVMRGADIECEYGIGSRPLHVAIQFKHLNIVEFLLICGADIEAEATDNKITPLICTILIGTKEILEYLIKCGANISGV